MKRGLLIAFEGLNASGKTSIIGGVTHLLNKEFIKIKHPPKEWRENPKVQALVHDKPGPKFTFKEEIRFTTDLKLKEQENIIIPALLEGKTVLTDRYIFSLYAYYMEENMIDIEDIFHMTKDLLLPDLTIYPRVPAEVSIERLYSRPNENRQTFQFNLERSKKSVVAFDTLAECFHFKTIHNHNNPLENSILDAYETITELQASDPELQTIGDYLSEVTNTYHYDA